MIVDKNQKHKLVISAIIKLFLTIIAYTNRNNPDIETPSGNSVVADEAIAGDCVNPIKKNDNNAVDGSPPIKPPILLPNLMPASTVKYIQQLPVMNVMIS